MSITITFVVTNGTKKAGVCCLLQILLLIPALGLVLLALYLNRPLVGGAATAVGILKGYRCWYIALAAAGALGMLIVLVGNIAIFVSVLRSGDFSTGHIYMLIITLLLAFFCSVVMVVSEDVVPMIGNANEDLAAIESGELAVLTTYIHEKSRNPSPAGLPGPYTENQAKPLWVLAVGDERGAWTTVYLPGGMDPHTIREDGYLSAHLPFQQQDYQLVRITYTPHFRVVTDLVPVDESSPR